MLCGCVLVVSLQVRWLARLSDPAVRFVDKIIGEAVVSVSGPWIGTDGKQSGVIPWMDRRHEAQCSML